jgi:hypothetical protein
MNAANDILLVIDKLPGITSPQLCDLLPHINGRTVRSTLSTLYKRRKVTRVKAPRREDDPRPAGNTGFAYMVNPVPAPRKGKLKPEQMAARKVRDDSIDAELARLRNQIAELEAWKADAIKRFPDLAVAPEVLQARKIVADCLGGDVVAVEDTLAGRKDHSPIMRATLVALQHGAA